MKKNIQQVGLLVLLAIFLTVIFTWPFALNIFTYYTDQGDYATHGSILWYNQVAIKSGLILNQEAYFQGYLFYPHPTSLAFANNHVFPTFIFAPIYWLSNNIAFATNMYVFLTYVASFLASFYTIRYFLSRSVILGRAHQATDSRIDSGQARMTWLAAIVGAFIYTFNAQAITRFPQHIELLGKYFLPLIFLYAYKMFEKPNFKHSMLLWIFLMLNSLTANYFQIFVIIFLPLFSVPFLLSHVVKKQWLYFLQLVKVSSIGLVFVPIVLYFNLPFWDFSVKEGIVRTVDESVFFSGRINDWFAPTENNLFYGGWAKAIFPSREPKDDRGILNYEEHTLFLGILAVVLFFIGLSVFRKQKIAKTSFFILLVVSFMLIFGPYLENKADSFKLPYYYLYQLLPFMKGIRSPMRFEYIFFIPFSLICAYGTTYLFGKKPKNITIITVIIIIIVILENFTIKDYSSRSAIFPKIQKIGLQNISFLEGKKVLHLPVYTIADADVFGKNSIYTNWLTKTGEITVNGNSGYFPPDILALLYEINNSLDKKAIVKLSAMGVDYIVIHKDLMSSQEVKQVQSGKKLYAGGVVYNQFDVVIIDIAKLHMTPKLCLIDRDFNIHIEKELGDIEAIGEELSSYSVSLSNKSNCYLPSIYNDRYRQMNIDIDGKTRRAFLRMPILIGPGEEVVLSENGKDLKIE